MLNRKDVSIVTFNSAPLGPPAWESIEKHNGANLKNIKSKNITFGRDILTAINYEYPLSQRHRKSHLSQQDTVYITTKSSTDDHQYGYIDSQKSISEALNKIYTAKIKYNNKNGNQFLSPSFTHLNLVDNPENFIDKKDDAKRFGVKNLVNAFDWKIHRPQEGILDKLSSPVHHFIKKPKDQDVLLSTKNTQNSLSFVKNTAKAISKVKFLIEIPAFIVEMSNGDLNGALKMDAQSAESAVDTFNKKINKILERYRKGQITKKRG